MSTRSRWVLPVALFLALVTSAAAQTVMTEIKSGTVVAVAGNQVTVRGQDGQVKTYDIPPDFRFDIDGQKVAAKDLKPGTKLTATIQTTTTPVTVTTEEIKEGEVIEKRGNILIVRTSEGYKKYNVPDSYQFLVGDKWIGATQLQPKMKITATMTSTTQPTAVSEREVQIAGTAPPPPPKPAPVAKPTPPPPPPPPPPPAPEEKLPKTGSPLPLIGLSGALALAAGLGLRLARRTPRRG